MGERSTVVSLRLVLRQLEHGDLRWRERVPAFPLPGRGEVHDAGPGWSHQDYAQALPSGSSTAGRFPFAKVSKFGVVVRTLDADTLGYERQAPQLSACGPRLAWRSPG